MNKKEIKICIKMGWYPLPFKDILEKNYQCTYTADRADYILFSDEVFLTSQHLSKKQLKIPVRIFWTGEAFVPDFNLCDYAISFEELDYGDRSCIFPLFDCHLYEADQKKIDDLIQKNKLISKEQFCNFIYSNGNAHPYRDQFFHLLSKYKKTDSFGKHLRNVKSANYKPKHDSPYEESIEMKKGYKFSIAFENALHLGYTTEKIWTSFLAGTIPIYWGDPNVIKYFNPKAFINCHDYNDFSEVIEKVKHLDNDHAAYMEMLNQPIMTDRQRQGCSIRKEKLENFIINIFNQPIEDARRRGMGPCNATYEGRNNFRGTLHILVRYLKEKILSLVKRYLSLVLPIKI